MIFDHRTYTGGRARWRGSSSSRQARQGAAGAPLGKPVLYGVTETGPLNTYVHVWAYESAADRERRRAAMQADPEWQAFLKLSGEAGHLLQQENRILTAAPFFEPPR